MNNKHIELNFSAEDARMLADSYNAVNRALEGIKEAAEYGLHSSTEYYLTDKDIEHLKRLGYKVEPYDEIRPGRPLKAHIVSW